MSKKAYVQLIDKDCDVIYERTFDSIKEAKEFLKDCGQDPKYWDYLTEIKNWHEQISYIELLSDDGFLNDYYLKN
jgi:hypothetical protein